VLLSPTFCPHAHIKVGIEIILGVLIALVARVGMASLAYLIVKKKGYKAVVWFFIGLLLGWIGVALALIKTENRKQFENDEPEKYIDEIAREKVNYAVYRMHNFNIVKWFVFGMTVPIAFSLLFAGVCMLFVSEFEYIERLTVAVFSLFGIGAIAAIDFIILYIIFYQWKKVDQINAVLHNARELQLFGEIRNGKEYTDYDYLCDIGADVQQGMKYQSTYLSISDNYIFGIVWADMNTFNYIPVIVPINRIKRIYCDYSGQWDRVYSGGDLISAVAGRRTYRYIGGYNIYLDNGNKVVIAYGNKPEMGRTRKKLEETGVPVEW